MPDDIYVATGGFLFSVICSLAVVVWGYGKLAGKVDAMDHRLDHIEREHSGVMTNIAGLRVSVDIFASTLKHLGERVEHLATKEDMRAMTNKVEAIFSQQMFRKNE